MDDSRCEKDRVVIHTSPDDWDAPGTHKVYSKVTTYAEDGTASGGQAMPADETKAASQGLIARLVALGVGVLLVLIGVPLLVLPGPGVVSIVAGLGFIATGLGLKNKKTASSRKNEGSL